jgi:hypothetical protein
MNQHDITYTLPLDHQYRWEEVYLAVSGELVDDTIDVLRCCLTLLWPEGGLPIRGGDAAHRVLAATCSTLAGLISAHEAHHHRGGARELVLQILDFLEKPQAREHLDAVRRDRDVSPDVVDALITLEPRVKALWPCGRPGAAPPVDQNAGEDNDP